MAETKKNLSFNSHLNNKFHLNDYEMKNFARFLLTIYIAYVLYRKSVSFLTDWNFIK